MLNPREGLTNIDCKSSLNILDKIHIWFDVYKIGLIERIHSFNLHHRNVHNLIDLDKSKMTRLPAALPSQAT